MLHSFEIYSRLSVLCCFVQYHVVQQQLNLANRSIISLHTTIVEIISVDFSNSIQCEANTLCTVQALTALKNLVV